MFLQIDCFDCFKVQRNESLVQHCFKLLNFNILFTLGNYKNEEEKTKTNVSILFC